MVTKKSVKKMEKNQEISIDWKIPAAFIAGILITALVFILPGASVPADNEGSGLQTEDASVSLVILNDASCTICDDSWIESSLLNYFPNMEVDYVDINSAQGQEYADDLSITQLPAAFFSADVENAGNFSMFVNNSWISETGDYYTLHILGVKDLTRTETSNPTVDLFVMSQCPYGKPAQTNMINAHELIPGFDLNIHYIGNIITAEEMATLSAEYQDYYINTGCVQDSNGDYYCSLHGKLEVWNNTAQLCAIQYYEDWEQFILADIENGMNVNETIQEMGYDEELMNNCIYSDMGLQLFAESMALPEELGLGSSPSYLFDNNIPVILGQTPVPSYDPVVLLCTLHPELSGCESTSSLSTETATGSC